MRMRTGSRRADRRSMGGLRVVWLPVLLACAPLFLSGAHAGSVPEASGPVCVPVPGMPCPGDRASSSSGSGGSTTSYGSSSGGRSKKTSNEVQILKGLQGTVDQMFQSNPAALRKVRETQMEGDRALQESQQAQQMTEEQRRQKAVRDAESARSRQVQELVGSLQGMPGNAGPKELRVWAGSGFDTAGKLAGDPVLPLPPPPPSPTHVTLEEKVVPPEKMTPRIEALTQEREALRERKMELQQAVARLETPSGPSPVDSAEVARLRQELAVTLNKESFCTFSINEELQSPSAAAQ